MITQEHRDAYRYALEDGGVPEVYAFMAAQLLNVEFTIGCSSSYPASYLLSCGFFWPDDMLEFWLCVHQSLGGVK